VIMGHAQDPHRKKMSKSKGNVVDPRVMIEKFNADALRFWAAGTKLGDDLPFMEKDLVTANKIITKLWNASKFAIMHLEDYDGEFDTSKLEVIDKWMLSRMNKLIKACTESFDKYEFFRTKSETELFFWQTFCDNYMEIAKHRLYNPDVYGKDARKSAQYTLYTVVLNVLKLFAPIMPYITEATYKLYFAEKEGCKSIHNANWPEFDKAMIDEESEAAGDLVVYAVTNARRAKSEKNVSLKTPVVNMVLKSKLSMDDFKKIERDITATTFTEIIRYEEIDKDSKIDYEHEIAL
ncbi:MAG: class I tRNA ligase family protein, partial [Nanoarchaeota archaeon]|nr:class I tRNA ligase family protein [Nanoarchaeota archaeon]